ncbi:MAG: NusG domain II-containing protein [Coriobacteriia bacterium]
MTRADRILLAALIVSALLAIPAAALASRGETRVAVSGPSGATVVDTADNGTYRIDGRLGTVVFEVRDGTMRCVSSTCPDKLCVDSGAVRVGSPVICAPNGVIAQLTGETGGGAVDAVSR